jgi:hypothetical protein
MFNTTINTTIDMVDAAKKSFVDFAIPQESLKTPLKEFIKTQTQYTKDAVKTFTKVNTDIAYLFVGQKFQKESLEIFQNSLNVFNFKKED